MTPIRANQIFLRCKVLKGLLLPPAAPGAGQLSALHSTRCQTARTSGSCGSNFPCTRLRCVHAAQQMPPSTMQSARLLERHFPDLSTPAPPKSYYTRAHATREPKGCCSQNIKQTNWLPSNIASFSQDDPSYGKAHPAFCRLENECVEFSGAQLPSPAETSSKGGKQNDSNNGY